MPGSIEAPDADAVGNDCLCRPTVEEHATWRLSARQHSCFSQHHNANRLVGVNYCNVWPVFELSAPSAVE